MASKKGVRLIITLECTECRTNLNKRSKGLLRYIYIKKRVEKKGGIGHKKFC